MRSFRVPPMGALLGALACLAQACCGPAACPQARSGRAAVVEVERYKERNGRYPVVLDDIKPGYLRAVEDRLRKECPDCREFRYGTDSFGYRFEYVYPHLGPNRCVLTAESDDWDCKGVY
jgi:hypothetical protein